MSLNRKQAIAHSVTLVCLAVLWTDAFHKSEWLLHSMATFAIAVAAFRLHCDLRSYRLQGYIRVGEMRFRLPRHVNTLIKMDDYLMRTDADTLYTLIKRQTGDADEVLDTIIKKGFDVELHIED